MKETTQGPKTTYLALQKPQLHDPYDCFKIPIKPIVQQACQTCASSTDRIGGQEGSRGIAIYIFPE
jgi:hypothetical protein